MKILGIETSGKIGSLALVEDGRIIADSTIDIALSHSSRLIPILDSILREAGWNIGDLDGVGVGLGPGSFTGIRVGLAAGQGIAFGTGIPLTGIGSFPAMVRGSSIPDGIHIPLRDGGRGRIYGGRYRKTSDTIEELIAPMIVPPEELEEFCRGGWIVSPRWEEFMVRLKNTGIAGGENSFPRARWVAILTEEKLRVDPITEIESASPIYLSQYWNRK